jgi:hypothetical protein
MIELKHPANVMCKRHCVKIYRSLRGIIVSSYSLPLKSEAFAVTVDFAACQGVHRSSFFLKRDLHQNNTLGLLYKPRKQQCVNESGLQRGSLLGALGRSTHGLPAQEAVICNADSQGNPTLPRRWLMLLLVGFYFLPVLVIVM